jgi:regulatory protein
VNQSGIYSLENAKQKAYRYLALRPRSEKEVAKKLKEKGFPANIIQETLEKLRDLKYINDDSFSSQWARHLAINKLWGNRKIISDLQEKGINKDLIGEAIAAARSEISEEAAIVRILLKKYAKKDLNNLKEKRKIFQSLMGRGFPPGLILQKIGNMSEDNIHDDDGQ